MDARRKFAGVLVILVATCTAYLPAMHAGYIWDDDEFVTNNLLIRTATGLWRLWFDVGATDQYYPLAYSSFWLEYHMWGLWAPGSHIVNILLHALNACLVWAALGRLRIPGAWLGALLFAVHPVEVESVAWITERKNVLSAFFYLAALLAYLHFEPLPPTAQPAPRDWRSYAFAIMFFLCALWSKTVACSLPAALLLLLWWKLPRLTWRRILPLLPLFVIGASMGLLTAWMEKHFVSADVQDWSLTPPQRLLIAGRAFWFYLGKLLWPSPLIFIYPRWTPNAAEWWQWIYPAAALALGGTLWGLRRRLGAGPLVAFAYFALTLFPALAFVDVYPFRYSFVADHFQYLASIGALALAAAAISSASAAWRPATGATLLLVLGVLTWRQCGVYSDIETLYLTTIERNPACWMAHDNLSVTLLAKGQVDESIHQCQQALAIKPGDSEALVNLGNAFVQKGRLVEASRYYRQAIENRPSFAEAHSDLGNALLFEGRFDEAIDEYREALKIKPNYAEAHNNLGYAMMQERRFDEAIIEIHKALAIQPDYKQARENLDIALKQQGISPR